MTYYEIKKVFSKRSSKISLVIMLAVVVFNLYVIVSDTTYINENGHEERGLGVVAKVRELKKTWAGDLTEDKIRSVIEENKKADSQKQGFYDLLALMIYDYGGFNFYDYNVTDSLTPDMAADFYPNRIKTLKDWLDSEGKDQFSVKEKNYLIAQYEAMDTPLYYDYQEGWKNLFQYAPSINMIVTLVLSFLCAGIFSTEFQLKSSAILYSSYHGRNRAILAKVKAGLIIITVIYWVFMLLYTGLVLGILGADGANCPIQSYMTGWKSIYNIKNWQEYLLVVLGGYLGCLFMLLLTMLVSAGTNSTVIAVIVPFVLIFLPAFLSGTSIPMLNKILGILPDQLLQMNIVVKYFNLYEIGGRIFCAVPLLVVVYLLAAVLITPAIYVTYRKKQVY